MEGCLYFLFVLGLLSSPILLALVIRYVNKINELSRKVEELELKMIHLRALIAPPKPSAEPATAATRLVRETRAPVSQTLSIKSETATLPESKPEPPVFAASKPTEPVAAPATAQLETRFLSSQPSRTRAEWESLIGGKLLNRIGALALIIGIGFFLKYAFNNDLITEPVRVLIGMTIGAALLFGGAHYDRKGFQVFAQGLVGAGISILYLSVYASFNFYHLVPQSAAFSMMAMVTAVAFFQAFKYDSFAVAFLGWTGGFTTPFLLSTGQANAVGLFTYIAILDAGLLAVLTKKNRWVVLEPLTFGATWLIYMLWYKDFYSPVDLPVTALFLTIFWGMFYALEFNRALAPESELSEVRQIAGAFNAIFYYSAMYSIMEPLHHDLMGGLTIAIGAVYFSAAVWIKRRRAMDELVFARHIVTAVILLILATAIQFEGFIEVFCWSAEALILSWCAARYSLKYVRIASLALFGLALLKLFVTAGAFIYFPIEDFGLIVNHRALAFAALAAAMGASARFFKDEEEEDGGPIRATLLYICCALLFGLCTVEANDYFLRYMVGAGEELKVGLRFDRYMTLALVWLIYSIPLVWFGLKKRLLPVLHCGLGVLAALFVLATVRGASFVPLEEFAFLLNYRAVALTLILAGLLLHAEWLKGYIEKDDWLREARSIVLYGFCALLFTLCTAETNDIFRRSALNTVGDTRARIEFTRDLTLALIWMACSQPLVWLGIRKKLLPILYSGLGAAAFAVVWTVIQGASFAPIASFDFGLNYRAVSFVILLAGMAVIMRWLKNNRMSYEWADGAASLIHYGLCGLVFALVTVETRDHFRHSMIDASDGDKIALAFKRDMTIAMVWMAYSLPLVWRGLRKSLLPELQLGIIASALALVLVAIEGAGFEPPEEFVLIANSRAMAMVFVITGLLAQLWWMSRGRREYYWTGRAIQAVSVIAALLVLELATVETWGHFQSGINSLYAMAGTGDVSTELYRLADLRQLSLSVVWLVYSILLISLGIWRRMPALRLLAIMVFGISILKIFIYDLSFLDTLYRIFSFIGLGLILLTVSYLYHRFKSLILEGSAREEPNPAE